MVALPNASEWERHGQPYTPYRALIGGSGISQPGQSEEIGDTLDANPVRDLKATLLNLECPDMYAAQVTVVLGVPTLQQPTSPAAEQDTPPIFARITFGIGGTQTGIDVDWINGQMLSLPGSFVRLDAVLDLQQFAVIPDVGDIPRVIVPAMAGHLPVGQNRAPQRSLFLGDIGANSESARVPIPNFAASIEATNADPAAAGPISIRQYADAAGTVLLSDSILIPFGPLQLSNRARYASIVNGAGALLPNNRLIFQLSI